MENKYEWFTIGETFGLQPKDLDGPFISFEPGSRIGTVIKSGCIFVSDYEFRIVAGDQIELVT